MMVSPMRSHTPLQPDWLSSHRTARPAWCSTSTRLSKLADRPSYPLRPRCENMQGTDAAVLVPHDHASCALMRSLRAASKGVVLRS
ncbi:hypothetical protein D3C71_1872050 [compost metagenome]